MSFEQALSGLNAASKQLDVIGNNVANSGTTGYKGSQAQFADVFAASLSGSGAAQIGLGQKVGGVLQEFAQGNITSTSNPLDMAINGQGFFRLSNNGTGITYTRSGQFQMDKSGAIKTASGAQLTGYNVNPTTGLIVTTNPQPIIISAANLSPQATGGSANAAGMAVTMNLDSRLAVPATATFSALDPTSYSNSTSATIYDSLGNPHVFSIYFSQTATAGQWKLNTTVDGVTGSFPSSAATVKTQANTAVTNLTNALAAYNGATDFLADTTPTTGSVARASAVQTALNSLNTAVGAMATPPTGTQVSAVVTAVNNAATATTNLYNAMNSYNTGTLIPAAGPNLATDAAAVTSVQTAATNTGNANTAITAITIPTVSLSSTTLSFDSAGKLTTTTPLTVTINLDALATNLGQTNSATTPLSYKLDFGGSTQFGSTFGVNSLTQDGFSAGALNGFNVGADGIIQGRYSNGQTRNLGQVLLASFRNPQGLKPLGDNQWSESSDSGPALTNTPSSGSMGALQSSAVEESNVDLTAELVKMITAQRVYQANAQSIKTQDSVMQTLLNLR